MQAKERGHQSLQSSACSRHRLEQLRLASGGRGKTGGSHKGGPSHSGAPRPCRAPHPPSFQPQQVEATLGSHVCVPGWCGPRAPGSGQHTGEEAGQGLRRESRRPGWEGFLVCATSPARVTSLGQQCHGPGPWRCRVEIVLGRARQGLVRLTTPWEASLGVLSITDQGVRGPHWHSLPLTCFPKSAAGLAQCHLHNLTGHPTRHLFTGCQTAGWVRGTLCDHRTYSFNCLQQEGPWGLYLTCPGTLLSSRTWGGIHHGLGRHHHPQP